jgi:hypothetical protein
MKNFKALVRYFDRKENTVREAWINVSATDINSAWKEAKASFTTISVIEG